MKPCPPASADGRTPRREPTMRLSPLASLRGLGLFAGLLAGCSADGAGPSVLESAFATPEPARFAYAMNQGDGTVSSFAVEGGTGRLQSQGYFAFENFDVEPGAAAVWRDGSVMFLTEEVTETISVLGIEAESGALSRLSFQVGLGVGPHDVVVHPTNDWVYTSAVGAGQVVAFDYDPDAQTLEPLEEEGPYITAFSGPSQLLMDPRGDYLLVVHAQSGGIQTYKIGTN